jgi:hypothetical protein
MAPIPLTTTIDEIEEAIFHGVMKPITSALLKEDLDVNWTAYGTFFFCLIWMGYKFGPPIIYFCMRKANEWHKKKKPEHGQSVLEAADQVDSQSQLADQIAT